MDYKKYQTDFDVNEYISKQQNSTELFLCKIHVTL